MTETIPNLGEAVSGAVAALLTPEYVEQQVTARVQKLVEGAIDSALRTYSPTGKLIEEAVADSLKVYHLDLPSYGDAVAKILQREVESQVSTILGGKLTETVRDILKVAPQKIALSEIVAEILKERDYGDEITCEVEALSYGGHMVYLDSYSAYSANDAKHFADTTMHISADGSMLSIVFRDERDGNRERMSRRFGFQQRLRAYFACGTLIEVDEDNVCTTKDFD